jgi:hypothetical protein
MRYEVHAGWVGEGKLPLPVLLQERARRHSPRLFVIVIGFVELHAAGDERGRLQSDVFVQDVVWRDLEEQNVGRGVHMPEAPGAAELHEGRAVLSAGYRVIRGRVVDIPAQNHRVILIDGSDSSVSGRTLICNEVADVQVVVQSQDTRDCRIAGPTIQNYFAGAPPKLLHVAAPLDLLPVVGER